MAFFEMRCHSDALKRNISVEVLLPESNQTNIGWNESRQAEETYQTLYLLHGLSDDESGWMRRTSIERYARELGIAVVMPDCERSWYTDTATGALYFTFITEELPRICRKYFKGMSDQREYNMIAGLSMGGYGALKAALTYPERYWACASLSGAFDIDNSQRRQRNLDEWRGIFGFDLTDVSQLTGTKHDVFALARQAREKNLVFPKLYLWCGLKDSLIETNRKFAALLEELGVEKRFEESEGTHTWKWWDLHIQDALNYFFNSDEASK